MITTDSVLIEFFINVNEKSYHLLLYQTCSAVICVFIPDFIISIGIKRQHNNLANYPIEIPPYITVKITKFPIIRDMS